MHTSLCIIGHPSRYGGADTELDHQITCWLQMGVEVHICHTGDVTSDMKSMQLEERGCIYHASRDWASLQGMHCISFCNGEFLENLPLIHKHARSTTFVNCMTWNFEREIEMHARGLIDLHLYQTQHAYDRVSPKLEQVGRHESMFFRPYFDRSSFPFIDNRPMDKFRFGRISRSDTDKFNHRQLWIYETMTAPVLKEGVILGWGANVEQKCGKRPDSYVKPYAPGEISQQEFYQHCDAVIMTTDTFENLPRVGMEAMSSGSILIVDNRGGWKVLVDDGLTGWLCNDDREFVYKASRCAFEHEERHRMAKAAEAKLESFAGLETATKSWDAVFQKLAAIDRCAA